ncbi:serine/threonine protein kinase [Nocardiopsis sp. Huas11]|uniref:protein kinase domain-containing protein n=1 Tax=Nocardiopsis sp. Huas11 TaxID=2183912 RepID=UPI000EABC1FC|nr:protein kinase [Nocardiopsis sp. Huas11]RKS06208.1 serine/threonine protein kinase [Nocardiopsis sp. Huas11]
MRSNSRRESARSPVPDTHSLTTLYCGAAATLYQGERESDGAPVVVKLLERSPELNRRTEHDLWDALSASPGVQPLLRAGTTDEGRPYLLMEHSPDGSYQDLLERDDPLSVEEVAGVGVAVAEALAAVHDMEMLHHAVTPANILRTPSGPALIDFGSALPLGHPFPPVYYSRATLRHAPPEELRGQDPRPASDVYRLASTLWTLLEGRAPFDDADGAVSVGEYRNRVLTAPVPALSREDVPEWLASALRRAMDKDPQLRPRSASEFARELRLESAPVSQGRGPDAEADTEPEPAAEPEPDTGPGPDAAMAVAEEEPEPEEGADDAWWEDAATESGTVPTPVLGRRGSFEDTADDPWWEDLDATESVAGTESAWWEEPGTTDPDVVPRTEPEDRDGVGESDASEQADEIGTEAVSQPISAVRGFRGLPDADSGSDRDEDSDSDGSGAEDADPAGERATSPSGATAVPAVPVSSMASLAPAPPEAPTAFPSSSSGGTPPAPEPRHESRADMTGPTTPARTPSYGPPQATPRFAEYSRPATPYPPRPERREPEPVDDWMYRDDLSGSDPEPRRSRIPAGVLTAAGIVLVVVTLVLGGFVALRSFSGTGEDPSGAAQGEQDPNGESQDRNGQEGQAGQEDGSGTGAVTDLAPTEVELSDESFSVSLTWTDNSGGETPHVVVGGPVGAASTTMADVESGTATVEISGLNAEVDYCFRVVAVRSADVLAPSSEVCTDRG